MRKRIGIEDFLRWAYRDELPKAQADEGSVGPASYGGAWGGVERYGELGTVIDRENRYGVVPDPYARAEPHPDAVLAAGAVERLTAAAFELPEGWYPIADLGPRCPLREAAVGQGIATLTYPDATGLAVLRPLHAPGHLIRRAAVLGACPVWEGDVPEARLTLQANGKPAWFRRTVCQGADGPFEIEVKGTDRHGHPYPDAYQRPYLDPCPLDTIVSRGEYELWRSALDVIHAAVVGRLSAYAVEASDRPVRPWETGDRPKRRVVHSLLRVSLPLEKAPVRPRKRPSRAVSPVRHPLQGAA